MRSMKGRRGYAPATQARAARAGLSVVVLLLLVVVTQAVDVTPPVCVASPVSGEATKNKAGKTDTASAAEAGAGRPRLSERETGGALQEGTDYVVVCKDAGAGGYEAFPDVCRVKDGRLLCVFYAGWEHESLPDDKHPNGGRICACYSRDEGKSWSAPTVVYDGPNDDRDPSVLQMTDGRILCNFFSSKPKKGGGDSTGLGTWLVISSNGGQTWSEPQCIAEGYYCSSPIRQYNDTYLLLGLYRADDKDANGAVTISKDSGVTWSKPADIDNGGLRLDAETDVIARPTTRDFYAIQRAEKESMRYSISADGGQTWSKSEPVGFAGHCPYLYRSPKGIIVCAHRNPNTSLHYSLDECKTWSDNVPVDSVDGAYPSMATLRDGNVLIVYYEEGKGSNIRARKFRIDREKGVTWKTW